MTVNDYPVEQVKSAKLLGLTLSSDLKWNEHVVNIVKKSLYINYIIHSIHNRIFSRSFNLFISATFRTVLLSVLSVALQLLQVVVPARRRTVKLSETLRI